jgi:hypothetical protein
MKRKLLSALFFIFSSFSLSYSQESDTIPPVLLSTLPLDDSEEVVLDIEFVLEFDLPVKAGQGKVFRVIDDSNGISAGILVSDDNFVSIKGNRVTINFPGNINPNTDYHVEVDFGAFMDLEDNENSGISDSKTWNFSTINTVDSQDPQLLGLLPEDNVKEVSFGITNFEMFFDESIVAGFGNGVLTNLATSSSEFPPPDDLIIVENSIKIPVPDNLEPNTCYMVSIPNGLIEDSSVLTNWISNTGSTQRPFVTTWKTDNPGASVDNQISIPAKDTNPFGPPLVYEFNVDWGDGTTSDNVTDDITDTYGVPGTYTVWITEISQELISLFF